MTPPRKPNGRDLVDYRELTELLLQHESRILSHINGFGTRLGDLDRETNTSLSKLEERIRAAENKLSEGKGRSTAFGLLGGVIAAVATAILLRGLFPTTPGVVRTPNAIVSFAPAPALSPMVLELKISRDSQGNIVVQPAARPSQTPTASPTPGPTAPVPRIVDSLCERLPPMAKRVVCPASAPLGLVAGVVTSLYER